MSERPILFSAPMVRAILEGRKTQTRRVVKPQPHADTTAMRDIPDTPFWYGAIGTKNDFGEEFYPNPVHGDWKWKCPYGKPGDRLWVRETWWKVPEPSLRELRDGADTWPKEIAYAADGDDPDMVKGWGWKLKPSIYLHRKHARILLEITDVRVQRLQEISEEDARAEGAWDSWPIFRDNFHRLWESINGDGSWNSNPWVWAITFRRVEAAERAR